MEDIDVDELSPSKKLFRSEGLESIQKSWSKLFGFCDPFRDIDDESRTLPFTLVSRETSPQDITVVFHERAFESTPKQSKVTLGRTISPLTSPREFHCQNGDALELSRRRLFSSEDSTVYTAYSSVWKWRLCWMLVVSSVVMYGFKSIFLDSSKVMETMGQWVERRWESFQSQQNNTFPNCTTGTIQDELNETTQLPVCNISSTGQYDTFQSLPVATSSSSSSPMDSTTMDPINITLSSLQLPQLEIDPVKDKESLLLRRLSFRSFLKFHIQQQIHWVIPLFFAVIPGTRWLLLLAILSRLAVIGA